MSYFFRKESYIISSKNNFHASLIQELKDKKNSETKEKERQINRTHWEKQIRYSGL